MPDYGSPSTSPPPSPSRRRIKSCARRCERTCCLVATYFPLAFVYSLTTWAVWTEGGIGFHATNTTPQIPLWRKISSSIGIILYLLLNASYTTAVFVDPGSPLSPEGSDRKRGKYSVLPTSEPSRFSGDVQNITVSSTGSARYCKKCHVSKPDRAHHCSTCKRCVLKMDHHCPWLATCLGLHNYKAFVLFLIYASLFCWACFLSTASYVWIEVFSSSQFLEAYAPVNVIILAVLSGIIGIVITGFTAWHVYLCVNGQTTIECLEQTRYLSGVRRRVEQNRLDHHQAQHHRHNSENGLADTLHRARDQLLEFHANAVPGASRFEEGEERTSPTPSHIKPASSGQPHSHPEGLQPTTCDDFPPQEHESPAQQALRRNYSHYEADREQERYEEYLDDNETGKLPNAFDLGWRRNLAHIFGENPWLRWLPVCNTTGDGWRWEVSQQWLAASEEVAQRKEQRIAAARERSKIQDQRVGSRWNGAGLPYDRHGLNPHHGDDAAEDHRFSRSAVSMQTLQRPRSRKQRRDVDATGEDGEVGTFEVSGSDVDSYGSSSDSDSHVDYRRGPPDQSRE